MSTYHQEHTINKVFVEVQTSSEKTANEFKNSIEQFLQEDLFPKIEAYLASSIDISLEENHQISKITLDVNLNTNNVMLDLKSTRKEITTQILKKLVTTIKQPEAHGVEIISKSRTSSKADAFFHFIQTGTNAWWTNSKEEQEFSKKTLFEITETSSFENRFLEVIKNESQRTRLINQFFNDDLRILFLGIYNKPEGFVELLTAITKSDFRKHKKVKKEIWRLFSEAVLNKQIKKILQIFEEEKINTTVNSIHGEKALCLELLTNFYSENTTFSKKMFFACNCKKEILEHAVTSGKQIAFKNNDVENIDQKDAKDIALDKLKKRDVLLEKIKENTNQLKTVTNLKDKNTISFKLSEKANKEKETRQNLEDISEKELIHQNKSSEKSNQIKQDATLSLGEETDQNLEDISNVKDKSEKELIHKEKSSEKSNQAKQDATLSLGEETDQNLEGISDLKNKSEKELIHQNKSSEKRNQEKQDATLSLGEETDQNLEDISDVKSKSEKELIQKEKSSEKTNQEKKSESTKNKTKEDLKNKKEQKENSSKENKKRITRSVKNMDEKSSVDEDKIKDIQYSKVPATNPATSSYINNVGLILLHPFLKQFFKTCGFLNEKNQLLKQEEAVHVLHYLATKKEQQLESNLIFEKFLCNVPIHQTITRDIIISDDIKEKCEELSQYVVQNWGILKKASTGLMRYEFLQRAGKLDLTKENPQITVERKVQDILLNKLPWSFSLCKLPWMDTLIFTNW